MKRFHQLSQEEEKIITFKHTERPGTGKFNYFDEQGVYICKRCDSPLYLSKDKFSSGCGWPSFDDELPGAVKRIADPDGERVEIVCAHCLGHLGHVFVGEWFTSKNVRHCVNSLSLAFVPAYTEQGYEKAYISGPCFEDIERLLKGLHGVKQVSEGYMGGEMVNPTLDEINSGLTGHKRVVEVIFDPKALTYSDLLKSVFSINKIAPPNHFALFILTEKQMEMGKKLRGELKEKSGGVEIEIRAASQFYTVNN